MQIHLILVYKMVMDLNAFLYRLVLYMSCHKVKPNLSELTHRLKEGETAKVGDIKAQTVLDNIKPGSSVNPLLKATLDGLALINADVPSALSGTAEIRGLSQWDNPGTGLEADDVTTLGIMTNYFFTDNISFEMKAGIPPKVDLQGKGKIYAPFSATATPMGGALGNLELENDIFITDLEAHGPAASARAWTPALSSNITLVKQV